MSEALAKTKILTTIGPASDSEKNLIDLLNNGADAFRLNFSHGSHQYFDDLLHRIHNVREKTSLPIPVVQDLQGPKIRVGHLSKPSIDLKDGDSIEITTEDIKGTKEIISTSYEELVEDADIGNKILLDDGLIQLEVQKKKSNSLVCKIIEGGKLKPHKGMNLPGMKLSTPSITEKDYHDIDHNQADNPISDVIDSGIDDFFPHRFFPSSRRFLFFRSIRQIVFEQINTSPGSAKL